MATSYTAAQVMDGAAALLNNPTLSTYTYAIQLPYLNLAIQELQELFQLNNITTTDINSAVINVPAGNTEIAFLATPPLPALPTNLIDIQRAWQSAEGQNNYIPFGRIHSLPLELTGVQSSQLYGYVWQDQKMQFLPVVADIDVKLEYIKELFAPITNSATAIAITNAKTFLQNRTAALIAEFVEQNEARAEDLNNNAGLALDRSLGINIKGQQGMVTRRRPFRAGFKRRSG